MRSDWDITREETKTTVFVDQPDLAETRKIRSTMTHRESGRVIALEENYTTPLEQDIVRAENLKIDRIEKAMASTASVTVGVVETAPPKDMRSADEKQIAALTAALDAQQRVKDASQKLSDGVVALKVAGADAATIDAVAAKLKAQYDAALTAVVSAVADAAVVTP